MPKAGRALAFKRHRSSTPDTPDAPKARVRKATPLACFSRSVAVCVPREHKDAEETATKAEDHLGDIEDTVQALLHDNQRLQMAKAEAEMQRDVSSVQSVRVSTQALVVDLDGRTKAVATVRAGGSHAADADEHTTIRTPESRSVYRGTSQSPGPACSENTVQAGQSILDYLRSKWTVEQTFSHTTEGRLWLIRAVISLAKQVALLGSVYDPCRRGAVLRVRSPLYVFGDIHGNYSDLIFYMDKLLTLGQAQYTAHSFMFLGDYVDRGDHCVEVAAYMLAMKALRPQGFYMLRGNHDDPGVNGDVRLYDALSFKSQCCAFVRAAGVNEGNTLYSACNAVFSSLPLVAVIDDRIFATHGGFPRYRGGEDDRLAVLESADFPEMESVVSTIVSEENPIRASIPQKCLLYAWDCMWADPATADEFTDQYGFGPNARGGTTVTFGSKAVEDFFARYGFELLIRGHQEKAAGIELSMKGRVLTVFSSSGYCGHRNGAGVAFVSSDGTVRLVTKPTEEPFHAGPCTPEPRHQVCAASHSDRSNEDEAAASDW
eukprot:TRINITY_DN47443_c0_g1_i1.p1 TRINITY_DN47443_c0_g1~~TRINITY_DN47443_c0_g1_i1.p1  ORF type:complete len:546 (+),score=103.86 TRINITY_DN47443_c0_g1_i1:73-1710(+)